VSAARSHRFRIAGRLAPPSFIPLEQACTGRATLTVRSGRRTLLKRALRVAPTCRLAVTVTTRHRRPLRFTLRFAGNTALAGASVTRPPTRPSA
jgi:hypothetical protein